jgi:beta-barrel assembly-enhancing protease
LKRNNKKRKEEKGKNNMSRVGKMSVILGIAAVSSLTLAGCKGGGGYSMEDEIKMGQQFAKEYDQKLPDGRLITDGPQYNRLMRIANRILPLAQRDYGVPYSVKLVDSKDINAFAVPGGPIYFYRGLIELAESDDEIASVLGHEVTHIVRRHSIKQMSKSQNEQIGAALLSVVVGGNAGRTIDQASQIILPLRQLTFSRKDEEQSDELGFRYLTEAGYNPDAMASFFTKMGKKNGSGGIEFLQSHPLTNKRVEKATERATAYRAQNPGK